MNSLGTFILQVGLLVAAPALLGHPAGYESFEAGVPSHITGSRKNALRVTSSHSKHGGNALHWEWRGGDSLRIQQGIGNLAREGGFLNRPAFGVWVYLEEPLAGSLVFQFREGERVTGSFRFPLQFSGWRVARLHYHEFPEGQPTSKVDNIRICAPNEVPQGAVYLDCLGYNLLTYPSASINPEKLIPRQSTPYLDERLFPKVAKVSEAELAGLQKLKGPLRKVSKLPGIPDAKVEELHAKIRELGVWRDAGGVHGPGLDARTYYCAGVGEYGGKDVRFWPDEHGPDGLLFASPKPFNALALQFAQAFHASIDERQRARLSEGFLLLADFLQDQGEALEAPALTSMRELLGESGRFPYHFEALVRARGGDTHYVGGDTPVRSNMDFYSHYARNLMDLCLIPADPAEQVRWMNAWTAMLERSLSQPSGAFKVDGSAYHHGGHYHSYAQGAFANFARLHSDLRGTPWQLSPAAHEQLRRAMLAQRLYANRFELPLSLKGRSPFWPDYGVLLPYGVQALDTLARLGSPDGTEPVDREVAAAYLRLAPAAAGKEPYSSLGVQPEPEPNGTFVMPYAALLAHRRDNWLVCVRGQSRYCWGSERQARRNCYGPFLSFGALEILAAGDSSAPASNRKEGAGWDWARFEGTTAPHFPLVDLEKAWPQGSEVTRSPETFVGGLAHLGRQGVFTMILNQTVTPGGASIQGRRSWFFNDERILCLGSDISCGVEAHPTQTTLCQQSLRAPDAGARPSTPVDGGEFAAFPDERTFDRDKPHWFLDLQKTGFYLPAGQSLGIARKPQKSRDVNDWEDTEGDFLSAWIDHGKAPVGAGLEYLAVVRATPDTMRDIASHPPYRVLQRDGRAHIVWDAPGRRFGCVFFEPQRDLAHSSPKERLPVKAVDRPCLIMTHAPTDGGLMVSVADPDLNLQPGAGNQAQALRVTLHGAWRLHEARGSTSIWPLPDTTQKARVASTSERETVLEIACEHGASYDLKFVR